MRSVRPLSTFDTVLTDTPAWRATSWMRASSVLLVPATGRAGSAATAKTTAPAPAAPASTNSTARYFIIGRATSFTCVPVMAQVANRPRPIGGANRPRPIAMTITVPKCSGLTPSCARDRRQQRAEDDQRRRAFEHRAEHDHHQHRQQHEHRCCRTGARRRSSIAETSCGICSMVSANDRLDAAATMNRMLPAIDAERTKSSRQRCAR